MNQKHLVCGSGLPILATTIVDWESQCIDVDEVGFIFKGMLARKIFNYLASLLAISRETNSNSIVDLATIVFLVDLQATAPPPRVNI